MLNPTCQPGSTAPRWNPYQFCFSVRFLMLRLMRRSRVHKYGNHMPACSVALYVCSLLDFLFLTEPHYRFSDSDRLSPTWAKYLPSVATFFFPWTFCHSFFTSWYLAPRSNCWLTLKGASSEFSTLCVIFSGKKRQEETSNQDNSEYFHSSPWIELNRKESMQLCVFPHCDTAAWL